MGIVTDALIAVQKSDVMDGVEANGAHAHDLEGLGLIIHSQLPLASLHLQVTVVHSN